MAIPEGWTQRTIGELAVLRRGLTWRKDQECESLVSDSLPVLRIPNVQQRLVLDDVLRVRGVTQTDRERYRVSVGSSLLVGSNGNPQRVGNCVFIDHGTEFLFASFLIAASVANTNIEPGYLFRILASRSVQDSISEAVQGSTGLKNINLTGLREIPVNLPPLPEQKKIAAILSSVDEVIAKTEAVIAQLQIVKKAMMEQLLTKGMPDRHTRFKQTEIGEIPEEWEVCRLPMIAEYQNGKAFPSNEYRSEGVLLVRPGNMHANGWLSWDDKHTTFLSQTFWDELPPFRVYPGELLMNLTAQSLDDEFLGRVCEVPPDRPCLLNQRIARITPTRSSARYLFWGLRGPHFRKHVDRIPQGSKVQHLYNRDLDDALLALPDTEEQRAIASLLDSIQERLVNETATLLPLRAVKSALSSSLLSGEIRVIPEVAE